MGLSVLAQIQAHGKGTWNSSTIIRQLRQTLIGAQAAALALGGVPQVPRAPQAIGGPWEDTLYT